jgi:hypothetical protein
LNQLKILFENLFKDASKKKIFPFQDVRGPYVEGELSVGLLEDSLLFYYLILHAHSFNFISEPAVCFGMTVFFFIQMRAVFEKCSA